MFILESFSLLLSTLSFPIPFIHGSSSSSLSTTYAFLIFFIWLLDDWMMPHPVAVGCALVLGGMKWSITLENRSLTRCGDALSRRRSTWRSRSCVFTLNCASEHCISAVVLQPSRRFRVEAPRLPRSQAEPYRIRPRSGGRHRDYS